MRRIAVLIAATLFLSFGAKGETVYFGSFESGSDTTINITQKNGLIFEAIEARASLPEAKAGKSDCCYGFSWKIAESDSVVIVSLTPATDGEGLAVETPCVVIAAELSTSGGKERLLEQRLKSDIAPGPQTNSFAVEFGGEGAVRLLAGREELKEIASLSSGFGRPSCLQFFSKGKVRLQDLVYEYQTDPAVALQSEWTEETLKTRFKESPQPHEGFWKYLDRETDDGYTRLGGEYTVGVIGDGNDGYEIIYIGGARTLRRNWHSGMIKGRLRPTIFENHYDLTWYDSKMNPIEVECSATFTDDAILTLSFPLLKSTLRFSRIPLRELTDR